MIKKTTTKKTPAKAKKAAPVKGSRKPTPKQIRAAKLLSENIRSDKPESVGKVLQAAGYSASVADSPNLVTNSPTFQELMDKYLPDDKLAKTHFRLLETRKLEHMVFPLGPKDKDDPHLSGANPNKETPVEKAGIPVERTKLTDADIKKMLAEVNCNVKKIVHGDTGRHVYYWSHDAGAQTKALELAYKMKGLVKPQNDTPITFNFNATPTFDSKKYIT